MSGAGRLAGIGLLGLGLGCRPVPATLELHDDDPPPPPVIAEPPPADQANAALGFEYVSDEVLALYRCWFRSPYEYMFVYDGEPLHVNGRDFGVFTAGVHGILYYGDLNNCAGEQTGVAARSYSDIGPIEALAGVSAALPDDSQLGFANVNPEFLHWARRALIPHPEQAVDGIPVQIAYDRVFRRFFRVMATSLMLLHERYQLDREAKDYLIDVHAGDDGIDWLEARYAGQIQDPFNYRDGTAMTPAMAAGFWLRRSLDGSYADCWHALREVLVRFDGPWLAEQLATHPRAQAALSALPDPLAGAGQGQGSP